MKRLRKIGGGRLRTGDDEEDADNVAGGPAPKHQKTLKKTARYIDDECEQASDCSADESEPSEEDSDSRASYISEHDDLLEHSNKKQKKQKTHKKRTKKRTKKDKEEKKKKKKKSKSKNEKKDKEDTRSSTSSTTTTATATTTTTRTTTTTGTTTATISHEEEEESEVLLHMALLQKQKLEQDLEIAKQDMDSKASKSSQQVKSDIRTFFSITKAPSLNKALFHTWILEDAQNSLLKTSKFHSSPGVFIDFMASLNWFSVLTLLADPEERKWLESPVEPADHEHVTSVPSPDTNNTTLMESYLDPDLTQEYNCAQEEDQKTDLADSTPVSTVFGNLGLYRYACLPLSLRVKVLKTNRIQDWLGTYATEVFTAKHQNAFKNK